MNNVAIVTDSNSGITQEAGNNLGISVMPMPFYINGELFYEDITLTQEEFYKKLEEDAEIHTAAPAVDDVLKLWDSLLKDYDEIVHIPMSSALSGACSTAQMLARDYDGRVFVVDNQRITVTQRQSVLDAIDLANAGKSGQEIHDKLMDNKSDSSIYLTMKSLHYLSKGGRLTPAAAAMGTLLRIKPVLQIQGEKLDAFARVRTIKQAKLTIINQVKSDCSERFGSAEASGIHLAMAYTDNPAEGEEFKREVLEAFPEKDPDDIVLQPLSLSVACHIGPGCLLLSPTKAITID